MTSANLAEVRRRMDNPQWRNEVFIVRPAARVQIAEAAPSPKPVEPPALVLVVAREPDPEPEPTPPAAQGKRPWDAAMLLVIADYHCAACGGRGTLGKGACRCAKRRIFRACFRKWSAAECSPRIRPDRSGPQTYGMKEREFAADFQRVAQAACTTDQWRVLDLARFHDVEYERGVCLTGLTRGDWFHRLYEAEAAVGAACYEMLPYGLYPLDQYFSSRNIPDQPIRTSKKKVIKRYESIGQQCRIAA